MLGWFKARSFRYAQTSNDMLDTQKMFCSAFQMMQHHKQPPVIAAAACDGYLLCVLKVWMPVSMGTLCQ